jgi:hypothetical protein
MFRAASRARRPRPELGATRAPLAEVILDREIRPPIRVSGSHRSASILAVDFSSRAATEQGRAPVASPLARLVGKPVAVGHCHRCNQSVGGNAGQRRPALAHLCGIKKRPRNDTGAEFNARDRPRMRIGLAATAYHDWALWRAAPADTRVARIGMAR